MIGILFPVNRARSPAAQLYLILTKARVG
jgi:hypothetical protein